LFFYQSLLVWQYLGSVP